MARLTLAEQIAQLESGPLDFDPEDPIEKIVRDSDHDDAAENGGAARDHYVQVEPSSIRKLQEAVSDPKYEGVRSSRQQIFDDSDHSQDEDEDEDDERDSLLDKFEQGDPGDEDVEDEDEDFGASEEEESTHAAQEDSDDEPIQVGNRSKRKSQQEADEIKPSDLSSSLKYTRVQDRAKGKAVSRQLSLWDTLLDARIRLQKAVASSRRLPTPDRMSAFISSAEGKHAAIAMLKEALALSEQLFELQEQHTAAHEGLELLPRKKRRLEEEIESPHECETDLAEAAQSLALLEASTHSHSIQTLNKWSLKIQAVAPAALLSAKRNAFRPTHNKGVVELVTDALAEGKLLERTRVRRTREKRIGDIAADGVVESANPEQDAEIFDDTDFYQQLLRDIIDDRAGKEGLANGDLTLNRPKKVKKTVDTKASKGRKLRYEVHEKIQHFMVPVPVKGAWHEEQIDELFASLLGKGFGGEHAMEVDIVQPTSTTKGDVVDIGFGGLRVFG